jgi:putative colanic acid biosynthesis UDP-glucose lipid carrier transferase
MKTAKLKQPIFYLGGSALILFLGLFLSFYAINAFETSNFEWLIVPCFMLFSLLLDYRRRFYSSNKNKEITQVIATHLKAFCGLILLLFLFRVFFSVPILKERYFIALVFGFSLLDIALILLSESFVKYIKTFKNIKYALIAGTGKMAKKVEQELMSQEPDKYKIAGFINCIKNEECFVERDKVIGNLNEIHRYLNENSVDEIVIALPGKPVHKIMHILSTADYHGIRVKYIPDYHDIFGTDYMLTRLGQFDALNIHKLSIDKKSASLIKNSFDKVFAVFTLVLLLPLFLLLAVLIKLSSPGPVFYCPIRIGKGGKAFKVYKFRTMKENDAPVDGTLSTVKDDPRITRIGKVMRKYSLDELPQLFNVFIGNMSIVGPRPHRRYLNKEFQGSVYRYMIRHYAKPGITGWAQVNGWRGPTDTKEQKEQRTLHDLWYVKNWSFWLDIKIIFLTVFSRKTHNGAF